MDWRRVRTREWKKSWRRRKQSVTKYSSSVFFLSFCFLRTVQYTLSKISSSLFLFSSSLSILEYYNTRYIDKQTKHNQMIHYNSTHISFFLLLSILKYLLNLLFFILSFVNISGIRIDRVEKEKNCRVEERR
jgi:hypothetical protein